jgi:hypothetical protein
VLGREQFAGGRFAEDGHDPDTEFVELGR